MYPFCPFQETDKSSGQVIAKIAEINFESQDSKNTDDKNHIVKAPDDDSDTPIAKIGQQNPQVKDAAGETNAGRVEIQSDTKAHSAVDNNDVYFKAYTGPYDGKCCSLVDR